MKNRGMVVAFVFAVVLTGAGNARGGALQVGYYNNNSTADGGAAAAITRAGHVPVPVPSLGAIPADLDALWVLNTSNDAFPGITGFEANLADFVASGGTLIFHDRRIVEAATILPGANGITFSRLETANIDVYDADSALVSGPGGTIDDSTLDNGFSSAHGYAVLSSLPPDAVPLLSGDGANANSFQVIDFYYPFGGGFVYYSGVPLDFYLMPGTTLPNFPDVYAPNVVGLLDSLARVAHEHLCLSQNGKAKCWGNNVHGQLGLGDAEHRGDGPDEMGKNLPTVDLGDFEVAEVYTAGTSSCARSTQGALKCWGRNQAGQLGLGDTLDRGAAPGQMGTALPTVDVGGPVVLLAMGSRHSCALLDNGQVKCWGDNRHGQLGLGDTNNRGDAPDEMGANLPAVNLGTVAPVIQLSVGEAHSCALFADSSVKCWGQNQVGQLGQGGMVDLGGLPEHMGDLLLPVQLSTSEGPIVELVSGDAHNCVLFSSDRVQCWGGNRNGQLGLGDTNNRGDAPGEMGAALPLVDFGGGQRVTHLVAASSHNCALFLANTMKCWGANRSGQLGLGDTVDRGGKAGDMGDSLDFVDTGPLTVVNDLRLASSHSCARVQNGWKCWGENSYGQLGLGVLDIEQILSPAELDVIQLF